MPLASRPGSGFGVHCCGVSASRPRMKPTCGHDVAGDQRRLQAGREGIELGDRPREGPRRAAELAVGEIGPRDVADRRGRRRRMWPVSAVGIGEEGRAPRRRRPARPDWRLPSRSAAAKAAEKNIAVRAFCSETSVPKIGASGERTRPSTAPLVSTTEMVTWARLSSGRRIWARAALMILNASSSSARTSAAVSWAPAGLGAGDGSDSGSRRRRW